MLHLASAKAQPQSKYFYRNSNPIIRISDAVEVLRLRLRRRECQMRHDGRFHLSYTLIP